MAPYSPVLGRRGLLQCAAMASLALPASTAVASVLKGSNLALEIGPVSFNAGGGTRTAVGVNGSLPAPILHFREGDTVSVAVTNRLREPTSIHWHGLRVAAAMDGVPGFNGFPGIPPGQTFVYRLDLKQSGTYWYHSHSGLQEQSGLYGAIVIDPREGYRQAFERDYVVLLSDWTDEAPETVVHNLKAQGDYYNHGRRTVGTFLRDARETGLGATLSDRLEWGQMRMTPTDILDVSGATYTYLMNGQPAAANWTALFRTGERVRLRVINASSMSIFDVRIPGLAMTVVQADGNEVAPVTVDEFRIGAAETYDVIVTPAADRAYTIFAQSMDRSGYARGTLAPGMGMAGAVPAMDPRPLRTMADMGMNHGGMAGMDHSGMAGMDHAATPSNPTTAVSPPSPGVSVDNVAMTPMSRLEEPGTGLANNGRRVLNYGQLRALRAGQDTRPPGREITLRLTGNMNRYIWGFDGKTYSESEPIVLRRNERVRVVLINDTMMEHPIHLHGLWSELENSHGAFRPYKHTLLVKPAERLTFLLTADEPGQWAFHCHMLYHMETGMFREFRVT